MSFVAWSSKRGPWVVAFWLCAFAANAHAQAVVDDKGALTLGLDYQYGSSKGVVISSAEPISKSPTTNHSVMLRADYVPIDRLGIDVALPFMAITYNTPSFTHSPVPGEWDDGARHYSFQDAELGARYAVLRDPLLFTPRISLTVPLQSYATNGFAAIGRHLTQVHIGASVQRTLDPILPDLFLQASYTFTISQKFDATPDTEKINQNRHDVGGMIGYYFLGGKLVVDADANYRAQIDGVDFTNFGQFTKDQQNYHDALLKESFLYLGGDVTYALTDDLYIGVLARFFITGRNTRDQNIYGLSIGYDLL